MTKPIFTELAGALEMYFAGRSDVYAVQRNNGKYFTVREPVSYSVLLRHCEGHLTIGRYILTTDDQVKVGALDYDSLDQVTRNAILIAKGTLAHFGIPAFIEWSGKKGFHLWTLLTVFIPATKVRRLLYGVLASLPDDYRELTAEVFPKQAKKDDLGNLVKLPWGVHRVTNRRSIFLTDDFKPMPDWGLSALKGAKLATETMVDDAVAELPEVKESLSANLAPVVPDVLTIGTRRPFLFSLAGSLRRRGLTEGEIHSILQIINANRCTPLLPDDEIIKLAQGIVRYPYIKRKRGHSRCVNATEWEVIG